MAEALHGALAICLPSRSPCRIENLSTSFAAQSQPHWAAWPPGTYFSSHAERPASKSWSTIRREGEWRSSTWSSPIRTTLVAWATGNVCSAFSRFGKVSLWRQAACRSLNFHCHSKWKLLNFFVSTFQATLWKVYFEQFQFLYPWSLRKKRGTTGFHLVKNKTILPLVWLKKPLTSSRQFQFSAMIFPAFTSLNSQQQLFALRKGFRWCAKEK